MPLSRKQKDALIAEATDNAGSASVIVLTGFHGIDTATDSDFRTKVRETGGKYRVIKNTLAKRVLAGDEYADLYQHMKGETGYVFGGEDPVATCKAITDFAKEHDAIQLKSGYFEGRVVSVSEIKALAEVPPREVLLTRLATALKTPIQRIASVLAAPIQKFAGTLQAVADKKAEAGEG